MDEPLVEMYYNKLQKEKNSIGVLGAFCNALFDNKLILDKNFYSRLGRLVKLFGKETVFLSILESSDATDMNAIKLLNYTTYQCKKRFEETMKVQPFNDLTDLIEENRRKLNGK